MLRSRVHKHLRQLLALRLAGQVGQIDMNRLRNNRHKNTQTATNSINSTVDIQTESEANYKRKKK